MNLLLDTHAFLWFIANDPRLSSRAQSLIQDPGNRRLFSMASLWEIAIKVSLGKLALAQPFDQFIPRQLQLNQIEVLAIELPHVAAVVAMPFHHRDPFDRLMAAQCQIEDLPIVSADPAFDAYSIRRVWA
ncbi:MAG: type II toxin-antitoxin system VapC family toxin [Verrucomicrobiota bacterium]|jgi:PIN domain nuclease of toxin-antitoxin system